MDINKKIAELVCLAQAASDAGKGIHRLKIRSSEYGKALEGYYYKDQFIARAIKLIRNNKSLWRYCAEIAPDQNGNKSKVIYFTYNDLNGRFYQISFHSFTGGFIKELANANSGTKLFWDRKSSRISAYKAGKACKCHVALVGLNVYWH